MQHMAGLLQYRRQVAEFGDFDTGHTQDGVVAILALDQIGAASVGHRREARSVVKQLVCPWDPEGT